MRIGSKSKDSITAQIVRPGTLHLGRRGRKRSTGRMVFIGAMLVVVLALLAGGVFAYISLHPPGRKLDLKVGQEIPNEPINVLILGSDSREGLSAEELKKYDPEGTDRKTGRRSDTIMLLHLDPKQAKAVIVSFPRDLRVTKPDGKVGKINSIYQQGPQAMIDEVARYSGLPIQHYVEVNFEGFKNVVNALGGVSVYFDRPIKEPDSGLNVPSGCVRISGDQALSFVRVRKIDSDFGRIARQQLFIKLMMKKVMSAGTILNPVKLIKLADLFSKNVKTDNDLSIGFVKQLATKLGGFNSENVDMRQLPATPKNINGVSFVVANEEQGRAIFQALRERKPLPDYGRTGVSPLTPADVEVSVLNGTSMVEAAKKEAQHLKVLGFARDPATEEIATGNASAHQRTTVYFKPGNDEKARLVAAIYGAQVAPMPASINVASDVALVLGADYVAGKATPPSPSPSPTGKPLSKPKAGNPLVSDAIHECPSK
ncbi:MAG: LCP family protein [Actinomycetota bacterium]